MEQARELIVNLFSFIDYKYINVFLNMILDGSLKRFNFLRVPTQELMFESILNYVLLWLIIFLLIAWGYKLSKNYQWSWIKAIFKFTILSIISILFFQWSAQTDSSSWYKIITWNIYSKCNTQLKWVKINDDGCGDYGKSDLLWKQLLTGPLPVSKVQSEELWYWTEGYMEINTLISWFEKVSYTNHEEKISKKNSINYEDRFEPLDIKEDNLWYKIENIEWLKDLEFEYDGIPIYNYNSNEEIKEDEYILIRKDMRPYWPWVHVNVNNDINLTFKTFPNLIQRNIFNNIEEFKSAVCENENCSSEEIDYLLTFFGVEELSDYENLYKAALWNRFQSIEHDITDFIISINYIITANEDDEYLNIIWDFDGFRSLKNTNENIDYYTLPGFYYNIREAEREMGDLDLDFIWLNHHLPLNRAKLSKIDAGFEDYADSIDVPLWIRDDSLYFYWNPNSYLQAQTQWVTPVLIFLWSWLANLLALLLSWLWRIFVVFLIVKLLQENV